MRCFPRSNDVVMLCLVWQTYSLRDQCDQIVLPKEAQKLVKNAQACEKSPRSCAKSTQTVTVVYKTLTACNLPTDKEPSDFKKVAQMAKNHPIWSRWVR